MAIGTGKLKSMITKLFNERLRGKLINMESLSLSQTNSNFSVSPVTKLTETRKIEGDYLVTFCFEPKCSATTRSVVVGLYIDNNLQGSLYSMEPKDANNQPYPSVTFPFTFDGFHDFRVDFGRSGGGGANVDLQNVRIIMVRI